MRTRFIWILALCLGIVVPAAPEIVIAARGSSHYHIVISATAIPSERYAAEELQCYCQRICGVKFPIVSDTTPASADEILLGDNAHFRRLGVAPNMVSLGQEGFLLRTHGPAVCIVGGRPRGTLYGVYELLEHYCGVRWFTPQVEYLPSLDRLALPELNETHQPVFAYREVGWTEAMQDAAFAAHLRLNGHHQPLTDTQGGRAEVYLPYVHALDAFVPRELYQQHPEYFPLINGKRVPQHMQRCFTNPDIVQVATAEVARWIEKNPDVTIISLSQNDGDDNWCQCPNCQALYAAEGSHAAALLQFVNAVAANVERDHPGVRIDTLAYNQSSTPPKTIRPRRNVIMRLCTNDCDFAHALPTSTAPTNRVFCANLLAWQRIASTLFVWDYTTNFHHYLQPFPNYTALQANLQYFAAHGVQGVMEEGNYSPGGHGEMAALRTYLLAKLLWDPHADVTKLKKEFLRAYYGNAAESINTYLGLLQGQVNAPTAHAYTDDPSNAPYLNPAFLKQADALFAEAERQADNDDIRARVQEARLAVWSAELETSFTYATRQTELFRRFFAVAQTAGITHFSEGITLDEYERHVGMK